MNADVVKFPDATEWYVTFERDGEMVVGSHCCDEAQARKYLNDLRETYPDVICATYEVSVVRAGRRMDW